MSLADRFTSYREEDMSVCPGAHDAIDRLKAFGVELALVTKGAADTQRTMLHRFKSWHHTSIPRLSPRPETICIS
jgi:putative hydrolase of the HAD superfamily